MRRRQAVIDTNKANCFYLMRALQVFAFEELTGTDLNLDEKTMSDA